jgi:hypothetical protein
MVVRNKTVEGAVVGDGGGAKGFFPRGRLYGHIGQMRCLR